MYDAWQTAGVLRRVSLTVCAASTTPARAARSLAGAGISASSDAARHVPRHVRKSFAVASIPAASRR